MSRLLKVICATLFSAVSVSGQQIRTAPVAFDDLKTLLAAAGYEAFAFDLSDLTAGPGRYDMTVIVKEYESGREIDSDGVLSGLNKLMLKDFPEESRGRIRPEEMADPDAGVFLRAERLTVGLYPSEVDSMVMLHVSIPDMTAMNRGLELRGIPTEKAGQRRFRYHSRPFKIDSFESGKFIPLVLYGSMWFDARARVCRFCGEKEIAPDLSGEMIANIPHFYVIGIEFTEKQEPQEY